MCKEHLGVALAGSAPAAVGADADRGLLFEALANLVDNALKFAGSGAHVRLALEGGAGAVPLVVEDDGPGLGDKVAPRGTGLGQRVIAAMARSLNSRVEYDPAHRGARAVLAFQA